MGASHSRLSWSDEDHGDKMELVSDYTVEQRLYPGSGRMMRTYRLKHATTDAVVVCKTMKLSTEQMVLLPEQTKELTRIKRALQQNKHVAPFLIWNVGNPTTTTGGIPRCYMLRSHVYTTLSDRLASRPFLTHVEKLWIIYQLLGALQQMHDSNVVHGFLTTENIGLTSWNWVVLLDISSYKSIVVLPDDDPSEYLYYFQESHDKQQDNNSSSISTTRTREKRCYLAPERFYNPKLATPPNNSTTTPAMDIFSAGCCIMETYLNGERALDLGDLMEYRRSSSNQIQQKLNKIESSSIRAACRHMLSLNPNQRLSALEYRDRLQVPDVFESVFLPLFESITCQQVTPDARMAVATSYYGKVLRNTVGGIDVKGEQYFHRILGPSMMTTTECNGAHDSDDNKRAQEPQDVATAPDNKVLSDVGNNHEDVLLAQTQALLKKLESPTFLDEEDDDDDDHLSVLPLSSNRHPSSENEILSLPTSPEAGSSLLLYLHLILSTVRTVERPSSKLVALQLLERLGTYSSDETKLQRIVPTTISLLQDQDPLVRACAIQVVTTTLNTIRKFAPSDSKIFPQYVFKRISHLISDPSLVVRIAFARCIASLADTAHLFLDISHAVRLYEAVGSDAATTEGASCNTRTEMGVVTEPGVFSDDVANLLDAGKEELKTGGSLDEEAESITSSKGHSRKSSTANTGKVVFRGNTLISSTYTAELGALHEIVSRWVVHITTDQSDQSSPPKRSLLYDLARLCNFFGRDGVMAFILPQILAFLNDRRDWQLRAALFERLASVCSIIGRASTEHFVLPCLETALVDTQDQVMSRALLCLSSLIEMGLLSRSVLVTPQAVLPSTGIPGKLNRGLFEKYLPLLLYPSPSVRRTSINFVTASCRALGFPDAIVFLLPLLRPYLRFEPSSEHLTTPDGLERCLVAPWTRAKLSDELRWMSEQSQEHQLGTKWTSIVSDIHDSRDASKGKQQGVKQSELLSSGPPRDLNACMVDFLSMLLRSRGPNVFGVDKSKVTGKSDTAIEGSLKLAQHCKFPNQRVAGTSDVSAPSWFTSLRDSSNAGDDVSSCAIRSVSSLSQVYGLSVIRDPTLVDSRVAKDTVIVGQKYEESPVKEVAESNYDASFMLRSTEAKTLQGAGVGEWGSETLVDAAVTDTAHLVTKLNGLKVPPLPPNLGVVNNRSRITPANGTEVGVDSNPPNEWRPRADTLVTSSSFANGHTAPVSRIAVAPDDRYFVSSSYDGTVRVWESRQAQNSDGVLVSSVTYSGHSDGLDQRRPRINDVATLENTNSVVSGASDGSLHVWRVDVVSTTTDKSTQNEQREIGNKLENRNSDRSRVSGMSVVRQIDPNEGEIHAVSHFNTAAGSIIVFANQGAVHSMDLRQPREPFKLKHRPDIGYLTSMTVGEDRHWMITGTSRGFVSLWDIRFQQTVKLWQHSSASPVTRLATCFTAPPKKWGGRVVPDSDRRPFMFVSCGVNECGMFDVVSGACRQCFRVVGPRSSMAIDSLTDSDLGTKMPTLREVEHPSARKLLRPDDFSTTLPPGGPLCSSMNAIVGSGGGSDPTGLITGGDDGYIRYWDFSTPSKCFSVSGHPGFHQRSSYERVDVDGERLMLCRQAPAPRLGEIESSRVPRMLEHGASRTETRHRDSVLDLKLLRFPEKLLVSCSRDCTVKVWR